MGLKSILTWAVKGNPWEAGQAAPNGHSGNGGHGSHNGHSGQARDDADMAGVPAPRAGLPSGMIEAKPVAAPNPEAFRGPMHASVAAIPPELLDSVARHDAESAELLRRLVHGLDRLHAEVRTLAERVPSAGASHHPMQHIVQPDPALVQAIRESGESNARTIADLNAALAAQHQGLLKALDSLPSTPPPQAAASVDPATIDRLATSLDALPQLREHSQRLLDTCSRLADTVRGLSASSDANAAELRQAIDRLAHAQGETSGANAGALKHAADTFSGAAANMNTIAKSVGGSTERIGDILADVRTATSTREAQVADFARRVSTWTLAAFIFCGLSFALAAVALLIKVLG